MKKLVKVCCYLGTDSTGAMQDAWVCNEGDEVTFTDPSALTPLNPFHRKPVSNPFPTWVFKGAEFKHPDFTASMTIWKIGMETALATTGDGYTLATWGVPRLRLFECAPERYMGRVEEGDRVRYWISPNRLSEVAEVIGFTSGLYMVKLPASSPRAGKVMHVKHAFPPWFDIGVSMWWPFSTNVVTATSFTEDYVIATNRRGDKSSILRCHLFEYERVVSRSRFERVLGS